MAELFNLNLDRLVKALGLRENWVREFGDEITPTLDITQFVDINLAALTAITKIFPGGRLNQVAVPQPVVSVDPTPIIVPVAARWLIRGWTGSLVTSAVAANRQPALQIINNAGIIQEMYFDPTAGNQQVASTTHQYFFQTGGLAALISGPNFHPIPIGEPIQLRPGWQVGTKTAGIQAGDQWQPNIFLIVEEFADSPQTFIPIPGITVT